VFRTRYQDGWRDAEITAVKRLPFGNVLRRNTLQALVEITAIVNPADLRQLFFRVREKINAILSDRV